MRGLLVMGAFGLAACAASPGGGGGEPAPAVVESLANTRWVGVVAGNPDPSTLPRLEFTAGGRVAGYSGCNMLSGSWSESGGVAQVGPVAMTKRFCAGAEGEVEKRVVAAMAPGARATRRGDRLVITAPTGATFDFTAAAAS